MRRRNRRASGTELRRLAPAALLIALAAMLLVATGPASGGADKKIVSASLAPTSMARGATITSATLTITNGSGSQQLGSADLCVPTGFTVDGSQATGAGSPCATNVVRLRNLGIAPGTSRALALTNVKVPCSASDMNADKLGVQVYWDLHAKQSNDFSGLPGNNFAPYPFRIEVEITGACTLEFVTRPADTEFDPATGTSDAIVAKAGGPAIQVKAMSGGGVISGVAVTITSGAATDLTGGGATQTSTAGIASFSSLKRSPVGGPYTLIASADGFAPATSGEFFVMDKICPIGSQSCTVTKRIDADTELTATQSGFDSNTPIGVLIDASANPSQICGPTGQDQDGFRIEVRPLDGNTEITWRFTKSNRLKKPSNGQTYELCVGTKLAAGAPTGVDPAFPVVGGFAQESPVGSGRYWGILTDAPSSAKCDASYPLDYPAKIAEYSNGADAIQVACFPYPFDPQGIGIG